MEAEKILFMVLAAAVAAHFGYRAFQKKRSIDAADNFRFVVTNTLKDLYSVSGDIKWPDRPNFDINIILTNLYPTLSAAVTNHVEFVKDKQAFLNAWDHFRGKDVNVLKADQDYFQYTGGKLDNLPIETPEVIFHNNVKNLLKHAKN